MSECEHCKALRERVEKLCDKIDAMLPADSSISLDFFAPMDDVLNIAKTYNQPDVRCERCGMWHNPAWDHVCITVSPHAIETTNQ